MDIDRDWAYSPEEEVERAWAAGFFDGEGCFSVTSFPGKKPRVTLTVSQVEREPLERFARVVGGNVRGPYSSSARPSRSPVHQLTISGYRARRAFMLLAPYLSRPKIEAYARAAEKAPEY